MIGIVGPIFKDSKASNIVQALNGLGEQVLALGSPGRINRRSRFANLADKLVFSEMSLATLVQKSVVEKAIESNCELVINIDQRLTPDIVRQLKKAGISVVFWFSDAFGSMDAKQNMFGAPYDAVFLKDAFMVNKLQSILDIPVYFLPEACNPQVHKPIGNYGELDQVIIAGSLYPYRVKLLKNLVKHDVPLAIFGPKPPQWVQANDLLSHHAGFEIRQEKKAELFHRSKVVLNPNHPFDYRTTNARLFEATACGGVCITEMTESLPDLFEIGKEVLAYNSFDEMLSLIFKVLNDIDYGNQVASAAVLRAHSDHTFAHRVREILNVIE